MKGFFCAMETCLLLGSLKKDRSVGDWKNLEWNREKLCEYASKITRHTAKFLDTGDLRHLAAVACNAGIIYYNESK